MKRNWRVTADSSPDSTSPELVKTVDMDSTSNDSFSSDNSDSSHDSTNSSTSSSDSKSTSSDSSSDDQESDSDSWECRDVFLRPVFNSQVTIEDMPTEILDKVLRSYLNPFGCVFRLVCKRWSTIIPKSCLLRSYVRHLLRHLKLGLKKGVSPFLILMMNLYQISFYNPLFIHPQEDDVDWRAFFSDCPELPAFNWKGLVDDHLACIGLPPIIHRENIYAFRVIAQLNHLNVLAKRKVEIENMLTKICGNTPDFRLIMRKRFVGMFCIDFVLEYNGEEFTLYAENKDPQLCLMAFYGELLLHICQNNQYYFEIVDYLADNYPFNWWNQLYQSKQNKHNFMPQVIRVTKNGNKTVCDVSFAGFVETGTGCCKYLAVQAACQKLIFTLDKWIII